jgi:hypothetical protein
VLTEALLAFGLFLTRFVFRKDLKAAVQEVHPGGEFDTAYRLLDNTWRAIAAVMAWIAVLVISLVPWWGLSTLFRATNPILSRGNADVGSGVVVFVAAGFCLNLFRMAIAVSLARQEANQALARVRSDRGQGGPATALPGGLVQLALVLTRPTDFDFVLQAVVGVLSLIALVNYAHTQGYPL